MKLFALAWLVFAAFILLTDAGEMAFWGTLVIAAVWNVGAKLLDELERRL